MEKKDIARFTQQLGYIYTIGVVQFLVSVFAFISAYFGIKSINLLLSCCAISLACLILVFLQPWKISRCMRELYARRQFSEATQQKCLSHTRFV